VDGMRSSDGRCIGKAKGARRGEFTASMPERRSAHPGAQQSRARRQLARTRALIRLRSATRLRVRASRGGAAARTPVDSPSASLQIFHVRR
jgi:hypothetical protein